MFKKINGVLEKISLEEELQIKELQAEYEKTEEYKLAKVAELKQKLEETDYVACKIAEGVATAEDYADIIAARQSWRKEINEL